MGQLIPEDFPLDQLKNDAERTVVEALVAQLYDSWLVIPDVGMRAPGRDHQTDIVLVHPQDGVVLLEVKGHRMRVRDGVWCGQEGTPLVPQPVAQAQDNAYELRRRLRRAADGLDRLSVEYGIALPNTRSFDGHLPPDIDEQQLITSREMTELNDVVEHLATYRRHSTVLTQDQIEGIVDHLCPDVEFHWDPDARTTATRERLKELCEAQVKVLEPLAQNRRVMVRGGAGTGKTRLAVAWARSAWQDGDRVLLTCFNEPLAAALRDELSFAEEDLTIGAFLRLALGLPGIPPLEVPADAGATWWDTVATGHLHTHWPNIGVSFDTIVVDEAQDFSPAWLAQLEALLDPDGRRRMLLLADETQGVFERGFRFPHPDDGWVRAELVNNFRNARPIARLLRSRLGGAPAPASSPEGLGVRFVPVDDDDGLDAVVGAVSAEIERITDDEGRDPAGVCVATFRSVVRDELRSSLGLVRCEDRVTDEVVCENIHRIKGLEFDSVVLVVHDEMPEDMFLYVGISRAVSELVVVGPDALGAELGLS